MRSFSFPGHYGGCYKSMKLTAQLVRLLNNTMLIELQKYRSLTFSLWIFALIFSACSSANSVEPGPLPVLSTPIADSPIAAAELYLAQSQVEAVPQIFQSTLLLDRHGELIAELFGEGRRIWRPLSALSSNLISATLATEDASFFNNVGIDAPRIVVATLRNLQRGQIVSGASTITMQLARNLFLRPSSGSIKACSAKSRKRNWQPISPSSTAKT